MTLRIQVHNYISIHVNINCRPFIPQVINTESNAVSFMGPVLVYGWNKGILGGCKISNVLDNVARNYLVQRWVQNF